MPKKSKQSDCTSLWVTTGFVSTIALLVISACAWWGYKYTTDTVHDQLAAQKIYFPPKGSPALDPKEFPDLQQYAGQLVDNGPKAKAYADGFIGRHLKDVAGGKTYSEVSTAAREKPDDKELQAQKQTLFQGETLRGLLLGNGYGYWTLGIVAKAVAIATLAFGLVTGIFTLKGWASLNRKG